MWISNTDATIAVPTETNGMELYGIVKTATYSYAIMERKTTVLFNTTGDMYPQPPPNSDWIYTYTTVVLLLYHYLCC